MRILLTHAYFLYEDEKEQGIMKPYPPLGLLYISSFLEQKGFEHEVYDATFSSFEQFQTHLRAYRPKILGVYVNLMTKINVLRMMDYVKSRPDLQGTIIVLGGPEVRYHADNFLDYGADFIVFGEGEETMAELARHFQEDGDTEPLHIAGIAFRREKDGLTIRTGERSLIANLDALPPPNRKKINLQAYFDLWRKHHTYAPLSVNTMRGCPYGCKWCSRAVYGKSYRRRSPGHVVESLISLKKQYDFDRIWFVDDVFTINPRWMRKFAELARSQGLAIPYEAISRADRMNEEIVRLLKDSGCFRIWIGAESGSQSVLDAMNRMVKIEQVKDAVHLSKQYGIETGTFLMLGYPGETEKDIRQTLHYLLDADPDHFTITLAYPIKGTPFYEEVEDKIIDSLDWTRSTDRQIEFKRTYSRQYYEQAIRWIRNETAFRREIKKQRLSGRSITAKLRSMKARAGMLIYKNGN